MFIGHFGMGFAAKRWAPRLDLGTAFVAAQLPDVIWPVLVLAGVEHVSIAPGDTVVTPLRFDSYPWSHSLLMTAVWGGLAGLAWFALKRDRRGAWAIALLSLSHWVLDVISHRPDVPLMPGSSIVVGLGLWNSVGATVVVEGSLFAAGVWLYWRAAVSRGGGGRLALGILVGVLLAIYAANLLGPPPPGVTPVAVSGLLLGPIVWFWGRWVDRRVTASARLEPDPPR